jgi:hypothetical protein
MNVMMGAIRLPLRCRTNLRVPGFLLQVTPLLLPALVARLHPVDLGRFVEVLAVGHVAAETALTGSVGRQRPRIGTTGSSAPPPQADIPSGRQTWSGWLQHSMHRWVRTQLHVFLAVFGGAGVHIAARQPGVGVVGIRDRMADPALGLHVGTGASLCPGHPCASCSCG